jgi:hypothetical protein
MNIADMTSDQLQSHIKALDESHKRRMKALRALARAKLEEERAEGENE